MSEIKARKQHGFSLIEMLIVVAIITIVCGIALPFFGGFIDNRNLKTAARDLTGDIFECKERALAEDRMYRIEFNGNSYQIEQCIDNRDSCANYGTVSTITLSDIGRDITFGRNTPARIVFQKRGTVTNSTITLQNSRQSTASVVINIMGRPHVEWDLK